MNPAPFRLDDRTRAALILTSIVVLILAGLAVAVVGEKQHRVDVRAEAQVQAQVLAETVGAALAFGDRKALHDYVNALRVNENLEAAAVFDDRGERVASFIRGPASDTGLSLADQTDGRHVVVVAPVTQGGTRLGSVYLKNRIEPLSRRLARYVAPGLLLLMATIMLLVMTLDGRRLRAANRRLLDQIAETERAEAALRQSQKMEAVGRLTGGIAHDFNNMLSIVLGSLDIVQRRYAGADERLLKLVEQAQEGARRAANLTQRLLAFSRLQPLKPESADINRAVGDMTNLLRRTLTETITVETVLAGGLWPAFVDLPQLETAIVNLAINARDAMPNGGKLIIETANTHLDRAFAAGEADAEPGDYVMISITDTGTGIPEDILQKVFEPFFTTKPVGVGTGLGLSQVHGFIKQSGGQIRIDSTVGVGTAVKLYVPRSTEAAPPDAPAPQPPRPAEPKNVTVLLVEDDDGVRRFAVQALLDLGYDVAEAANPEAALRLLDARSDVSILLTDVVMPAMNGRELADLVLARRPDVEVIFMTGYTQDAIMHNGMLDPGTRLIRKPFTLAELDAELGRTAARASGK